MHPPRKVSYLLLCLITFLFTVHSNARTFNITAGDVNGLIDAINQANANDEEDFINLAAGEFALVDPVVGYALVDTGLPIIRSPITIRGANFNNSLENVRTSIRVDYYHKRLINVAPGGRLTLSHLEIMGYSDPGTSFLGETLCDGVITEDYCSVRTGGLALVLQDGALIVNKSRLSNAESELGGHIYNAGLLEIVDSEINHGYASDTGGAIFNSATGVAKINTSLFFDNYSDPTDSGTKNGDVMQNWGDASFFNSTLSNLDPVHDYSGSASVTNRLTLKIKQTTIVRITGIGVNNYAVARVGSSFFAKYVRGSDSLDPYLRFRACRGNPVRSDGYNVMSVDGFGSPYSDLVYGCIQSQETDRYGTDDQPLEPHLGPLADNGGPTRTHSLKARSPAVNLVARSSCSIRDQRGIFRLITASGLQTKCDAGAFEYHSKRCLLPPAACSEVTKPEISPWLNLRF